VWRSWLARRVWDAEAGGSSPLTPTMNFRIISNWSFTYMKSPVYLAIPNYNMGSQLDKILPSVIGRGYARIYVLDDCSTDNSEQIVKKYKKDDVIFISGDHNVGAGGNRNKILDYEKTGIAHFIDADAVLQGKDNVADRINSAFDRHKDAAVIGFRSFKNDGSQFDWNFGPQRKKGDSTTWFTYELQKRTHNMLVKKILKIMFGKRWDNFWTYTHPESAEYEQKVGAVAESNMALRLDEILSLACKLSSINKEIWYVPEVPVSISFDVNVRPHKSKEFIKATILLDFKRFTGKYKIKA
jgi:glycosyltransferase involved in cell wall biosynthesis